MIKQTLPNGPKTPKLLQLLSFGKDSIKMLTNCQSIYGDRFTLRFPGQQPYIMVSSPKDLKAIFMEHSGILDAGAANGTVLKPILGENSLIILNNERHMLHRKLMLPPFHGERIKLYGKAMQDITIAKISEWKTGEKKSIYQEALHITFDIIINKIFGIEDSNDNYPKIRSLLEELILTIGKPSRLITLLFKSLQINLGGITPWAKIQQLKKDVDNILLQEIETKMNSDVSSLTDILSLLIQAKDEDGNGMSKEEIKDEMLTLLLTGHQTTACTIAWSLYYILSDEAILNKLLAEIENTGAAPKELYTVVNKLPYMDMVINETLRIVGIVPIIGRLTTTDFQLNDIIIPKGVMLYPAIYLTHHNKQYWPNPEEFIPERFAEPSKIEPYTFLPFGGGIRRCIGASFATYEIKIMLASILVNKKMKLSNGYVPKFIRKSSIILPSEGVPVEIM